MMADAPSGDIRSAILAELAAPDPSGAPAVPSEAAPAPAPSEDTPSDEPEDASDVEAVDDELLAADDDVPAEDEDEEVELKSDDPETQKRLDQVRRAEKRMREAAERREAEFTQKQREWQEKVDRVAEIDKLTARFKYDPTAVLRALGVSAEDYELIAQSIYAESPALQNDPKQKAAALAKLKEREKEDKLSAMEKKQQELEAKLEATKREAAAQAEVAVYVQQINATAAAKFPLVAKMLKADPEETNDALVKTYNTLGAKLNRAPKPAEVVAAFDKTQRARLAKLGIDPATLIKPKAVANTNAAAKPAAKPAASAPAPAATTGDDRDSILAELAALRA